METFVLSWMLMLGALTGAGNFPIDMFETTSHQFGTVVRGATTEYEFVFTNKYMEDVIVESVQSSCQCTTPTLLTPGPIKTHQQGRIKIHVNTQNFTGNKNATITVRFAAPQHVEMQLHSYVYIRSDVSVNPGIVYFGSVDLEKNPNPGVQVNINCINYGWKILDVQSDCKFLAVELKQIQAYQGTNYNMVVRLRPNAPPGPFSEVLELVTNEDVRSQRIPVRVEGRIKQTLSASPSPLSFNMIEQGKKSEKTLIIQGAEPFRITDITSEDRNITATIDRTSKKIQPIKLTYTGKEVGDFQGSITVMTNLEGGMNTSVNFNGKVIEPVKPIEEPKAEEPKAEEPKAEEPLPEALEVTPDEEETIPEIKESEKETEEVSEPLAGPKPESSEESLKEKVVEPTEEKNDELLNLMELPVKEAEADEKTEALSLNPEIDEKTAEATEELVEEKAAELPEVKAEEPADEKAAELPEVKAEELVEEKAAELPEVKAEEPADEKAAELPEVKAEELVEEKAAELPEVKAEEPADEKAAELPEVKAPDSAKEKAEEPVGKKAENAEDDSELLDLLPDSIEEMPEKPKKAAETKPKALKRGRNLLKK